ncbi:hypothetical protein VTK73DRAFT_870 [Phialemonium thermophilum]|uniref:Uncharacterized protein n=1 Tax=Phialemonium thermophilum TaxID=223376 RepID=A0ABR3Y373_9PEZI
MSGRVKRFNPSAERQQLPSLGKRLQAARRETEMTKQLDWVFSLTHSFVVWALAWCVNANVQETEEHRT